MIADSLSPDTPNYTVVELPPGTYDFQLRAIYEGDPDRGFFSQLIRRTFD